MHHCVYASNFHEKTNSLIMSASITGEGLESIEFDFKKLELVQARGFQNQSSAYHAQIIKLIEKNIEKIR